MKIKPLFDRIVLKNIKEERKSSLILPETMSEKSQISVVEAIGTGGKVDGNEIDFQVKVGDRVIYNKFSAHEFHIDGESFLIISQNDILGKLED